MVRFLSLFDTIRHRDSEHAVPRWPRSRPGGSDVCFNITDVVQDLEGMVMRRWPEEHDRSGSDYERRDSMRSREDLRHDDSRRRDRRESSEMRRPDIMGGSMSGRMDYERPGSENRMGGERYRQDYGRHEHDDRRRQDDMQRRQSYGPQHHEGPSQRMRHDDTRRHEDARYDRGGRDDSSHRFLYDNQSPDRRREHEPPRYQDQGREEYSGRPRYRSEDDDWDDRPRISGPVRLDANDVRDSRERRERESRESRMRAGDFEQYRGRDAGFSWSDGSNSSIAHDYDRWGNEYSNTSRREGMGWNRGSTRDPHFWSSPDRDR